MRLPDDTQHIGIYGKTGSGKTVVGLWHLVQRNFHEMPWTITDTKRDPTIAQIPRLEEIGVNENPPTKPGLYVVRPLPDQREEQDRYLWKMWAQENHGLFGDEAYMLARTNAPSKAFDAILTQGRSKRVPIIGLSQRPAWLSPFFMSECSFHQVLHVTREDDFKRLQQFIPALRPTKQNYHSQYYDDPREEYTFLRPAPNEDEILNRFDKRMPRKRRPPLSAMLRNA